MKDICEAEGHKEDTNIFDQVHPKIINIIFNFHKFAPAWTKSTKLNNSFLRYDRF